MADESTRINSIIDGLTAIYNKAKTYYDDALADLNGAKEQLATVSDLVKTGSETAQLDAITNGISSYINTLDSILSLNKFSVDDKSIFIDCKTALTNAIAKAKDNVSRINFEASESGVYNEADIINEIKNLYKDFITQNRIVRARIDDVTNTNGLSVLEDITELCGPDSNYIKGLEEANTNSSLADENISEQLTAVENIIKEINSDTFNFSDIDNTTETINNLKNIISGITIAASGIRAEEARKAKSIADGEATMAKINANKTKYDWRQLFVDAAKNDTTNFEGENLSTGELWDKYYEVEWENLAEKVRALGTTFTEELRALGFSANTNPFVDFIKNSNFLDIVNPGAFDLKVYNALHNSYLRRIITDKDLRGEGKLGKKNLIFNNNLYLLSGYQIEDILDLQLKAIHQFEALDKNSDLRKNYKNITDFISDLFYKGGNPLTLIASTDNTLKSITDIEALFKNCFGEIEKKRKFNVADLDNSINDIRSAKILLLYLLIRYCDNAALRNKYIKAYGLEDTTINYNQLKNWGIIFDNINITEKDLPDALAAVAEAGNMVAPTK